MVDHTTDWQIVYDALEGAPCATTWCAPEHKCSRCAALAALERLNPMTCACGWTFMDGREVQAGCPACAVGVQVDG